MVFKDDDFIKDKFSFQLYASSNGYVYYDLEKIKRFEKNITDKGKEILRSNKMYKKDRPKYKAKIKEYNRLLKSLESAHRTFSYNIEEVRSKKFKNISPDYYIFDGMHKMFKDFINNDTFRKAKSYMDVLLYNQKEES